MESLHFQYPAWLLLLCIACGLAFAAGLYFRDKAFVDQPTFARYGMPAIRFLTVTVLCMLLLAPFLRYFQNTTQDPLIIIAHDNSASIAESLSEEDSSAYRASLDAMVQALEVDYKVETYTFGGKTEEGLDLNLDQPLTDISGMMLEVHDRYADQNLGAVLLASDGLYNRGANPVYMPQRIAAPIHVIALGDTTVKTDMVIQRVLHNRLAFLGDKFPLQIDISANKLDGRVATLTVDKVSSNRTQRIHEEQIRIEGDNYFTIVELAIDANEPGISRYRVRVSGISNEVQYANNLKDVYIEVIDGRLEVLLLAAAPHPDIAAIKEQVTANDNYAIEVFLVDDFTGEVSEYDLAILHQLPATTRPAGGVIEQLKQADVSVLYILGKASSLPAFNNVQSLLNITGSQQAPNEVSALVETGFQLFKVDDNLENQLNRFPPLAAPFGEYVVEPGTTTYLRQKIGNVETEFPLVVFGSEGDQKIGILAAEGMWRWRLYDFLQNESHELTNGLINKTIQYLTIKDDKRKFRTSSSRRLYNDNEPVVLDAELYNQSYELVNTPDAFVVIRDSDGNEYNYTFNRTRNSYTINIGQFVVGDYQFTAYTDYDGTRQEATGRFTVQEIQLEKYQTQADHNLLYALARRYRGQVFYPTDLATIPAVLSESEDLRPVVYQSIDNQPLMNMRLLFLLLLILLTGEWFLRRYFGGY